MNLELLCQRAASDHRYLGLATKDYLKSRMRENRTSGSVRGSRQSLRSKNYVKGVSRLSTRLSRVLPINKEIFGAFVAQLRKEKGLVRENVAEQGSLLDENWSPE